MVKCIDAFHSKPKIPKTHIQNFPCNKIIDRDRPQHHVLRIKDVQSCDLQRGQQRWIAP